mmetsp:Transcript_7018/g.22933  ORF Transcript_7018/g.22933 Transcript_7018/m.22933 type:complete len:214 (+) Transcript_7018:340-981(+)
MRGVDAARRSSEEKFDTTRPRRFLVRRIPRGPRPKATTSTTPADSSWVRRRGSWRRFASSARDAGSSTVRFLDALLDDDARSDGNDVSVSRSSRRLTRDAHSTASRNASPPPAEFVVSDDDDDAFFSYSAFSSSACEVAAKSTSTISSSSSSSPPPKSSSPSSLGTMASGPFFLLRGRPKGNVVEGGVPDGEGVVDLGLAGPEAREPELLGLS